MTPPTGDHPSFRGTGKVHRSKAGAHWWMYQRPPVTVPLAPTPSLAGARWALSRTSSTAVAADQPARGSQDSRLATYRALLPSGLSGGVAAAGLLALVLFAARVLRVDWMAPFVIPIVGVIAAVSFGNRCARVHPDEPWLPRLILYGVLAKLTASYLRYVTLTQAYDGVGDATRYDIEARKFVAAWVGDGAAPVMSDFRQTNFIKLVSGIVYFLFGQSLLGAFLLFGLLAVVGSYFWFRALACALPHADKRLFLMFMLFAPSIVFWPSALGKEALMHVGLGALAWAVALILRGQAGQSLPLLLGGGWLVWVVRPHLLAIAAVAGAAPYFVGQFRQRTEGSFFARPIGMVIVGAAVLLTVTTSARFLGIEKLSVSAIEEQLDETTAQTSQGGSAYAGAGNSLNPVFLPLNIVTVLVRPFPWEARSAFQLAAALESAVLIGLIARRFGSVQVALRRMRLDPFVMFCVVLIVLYAMLFSSLANFGLLSRQRSLALPALYVLLAVDPARLRDRFRERAGDVPEPVRPGA